MKYTVELKPKAEKELKKLQRRVPKKKPAQDEKSTEFAGTELSNVAGVKTKLPRRDENGELAEP